MKKTSNGTFTLGRAAMEKINAVEGAALPTAVKEAFEGFDRQGLSAQQRHEALQAILVTKVGH